MTWLEEKVKQWEESGDVRGLMEQLMSMGEEFDSLQKRHDTFIKDCGITMSSCPDCGHGMSSRDGCLHCRLAESEKAREEKDFDYQQLAEAYKQEAITADTNKLRAEAAEAREADAKGALREIKELIEDEDKQSAGNYQDMAPLLHSAIMQIEEVITEALKE